MLVAQKSFTLPPKPKQKQEKNSRKLSALTHKMNPVKTQKNPIRQISLKNFWIKLSTKCIKNSTSQPIFSEKSFLTFLLKHLSTQHLAETINNKKYKDREKNENIRNVYTWYN